MGFQRMVLLSCRRKMNQALQKNRKVGKAKVWLPWKAQLDCLGQIHAAKSCKEGDLYLIQLLLCVLITSESHFALKNVHPLIKQLLLVSFSYSSVFQEADAAPESLGDLFSLGSESVHVAFLCNHLGVSVFAFYRTPEENSIPAFLLIHFSPKLDIAPKTWICVQLQHSWSHGSKMQEEELKLQHKAAFLFPPDPHAWAGWEDGSHGCGRCSQPTFGLQGLVAVAA